MSEISETEIKSMTKEQNYMCGYKDGKSDVLDKIRAEIEASKWTDKDVRIERNALASGLDKALEIIDKYRAESEVEDVRHRINY